MKKKGLLVLIISVLVAGGAFAQSDFASMAKNTVTVDVGPTILGFAIGKAVDFIGEEGITGNGFGIAGQYERQLSRPLSAAGRFSYLRADMGMKDTDESGSMDVGMSLVSFSVEGHVRLYPFGDTFFLDGMVGYANFKTDFDGKLYERGSLTDSLKFQAERNYVKLGAKLGWRFSFGKNGGFTFEPAVGYSYGIGMGASIGKQVGDKFKEKFEDNDFDTSSIADMALLLENFVFIGGPRFSLAFGYRF
jgi:hypothetical protein